MVSPRQVGSRDTAVLEIARRLVVLLSAGLSAPAAWRHLALDDTPELGGVADAAVRGDDVAAALRRLGPEWGDLAAVWHVATAVGAPLAATVRAVAGALQQATEIRDDVRVALAEPRSTARMLAWLPVVGIPLGSALGFDMIGALTGDVVGIGLLLAGLGLTVSAHVWSTRLIRRAQPAAGVPGLRAELLAIAVSGGVAVADARRIVAEATDGAPTARPDRVGPTRSAPPDEAEIERVLALSERAGVPARELLRGSAWLARQRARSEGRAAAARLSARLVLPLGACTLPAFLLLAVAPMILGIVRSEVLAF